MAEILSDEIVKIIAEDSNRLPEVIGELVDAQTHRTRHTLNLLAATGGRTHLYEGANLLSHLPESARDAAIGHPLTALWSKYCKDRTLDREYNPEHDFCHYGAIAAGAAIQAGEPFDSIRIPVHPDGSAMLPGIGRARFTNTRTYGGFASASHTDEGVVEITAGDETIYQPTTYQDSPHWQAVRYLGNTSMGQTPIEINDLDPYRKLIIGAERDHALPAERLTDRELKYWQTEYEHVHAFLKSYIPTYRAIVDTYLRSIVPLINTSGSTINVTRSTEFGIIGLSTPINKAFFVSGIVDELRNGQLQTLHHIRPLHTYPAGERRKFIPNENVPGSFSQQLAVLCGHTTIMDVESAQRAFYHDYCYKRVQAQINYAVTRDRIEGLLAAMEATDSEFLTEETGRLVIDGLRAGVSWRRSNEIPLPAGTSNIARIINLDHRLSWQLRNLRPDDESTERLAVLWMAAQPLTDPINIFDTVDSGYREVWDNHKRKRLLYMRAAELECATDTTADEALALLEYQQAHTLYKASIENGWPQTEDEAWAGFALVHEWAGSEIARTALQEYPEIVRAVYEKVRQRKAEVNIEHLASWLGSISGKLNIIRC